MFSSEVLEIALGLGFVYLLFSLVCTSLTEGVARLLRLRASTLKAAITNMLAGESGGTGAQHLVKRFYTQPIIRSLSKSSTYDRLLGFILDKGRPSYIPAHAFAAALMKIIHDDAGTNNATQSSKLRESIQTCSEPLKTSLLTLLEQVEKSARTDGGSLEDSMNSAVELWFQDVMDRANGWYTRKTRSIVVLLALFVTVVFNLDSLAIVDALSTSPTLRSDVADAAVAYIAEHPQLQDSVPMSETSSIGLTHAVTQLQDQLGGASLPIGWVMVSEVVTPATMPTLGLLIATEVAAGTVEYQRADKHHQLWPATTADWGRKLPGFAITIVALSLGAPFWFDALNKVAKLRATGEPPT